MHTKHYLEDILSQLSKYKELAEKAVAQVGDEDFFCMLSDESNSIAIIIKHMAGNMRSRWTDFLTTDGEKPDRNRDSEFVMETEDTRGSILQRWETGWRCVFETIETLQEEDLNRTVLIRNEPHSVIQAISRQLTHYAYHVGQIVYLARHFVGAKWKSLSVPKGKSKEFNAMKTGQIRPHGDR